MPHLCRSFLAQIYVFFYKVQDNGSQQFSRVIILYFVCHFPHLSVGNALTGCSKQKNTITFRQSESFIFSLLLVCHRHVIIYRQKVNILFTCQRKVAFLH